MNLKKLAAAISAVWWMSNAFQYVWAEDADKVQLTVNVGAASAGGNAPSSGKWGESLDIQGAAMVQATPWLAIGAQAGHAGFDLKTPNGFNGDPNSSLSRGVTQLTPEISVGEWVGGSQFSVKPYLLAGAGLYHLSDTVTTTTEVTGPCPPPPVTSSPPSDPYQSGY